MKKITAKISPILLSCIIAAPIATSTAFADVERDLQRLEQEIEDIRQQAGLNTATRKKKSHHLNLYGSFRPVLTVADDGEDTSTEVRDGLSRFGLTGSSEILDNSKVFFTGEWNVKLAEDGRIDSARLAFAGISGELGKLTIGKQRPPQYSLIGEHVDIFNHADSAFGYDAASDTAAPFFVNKTTLYQYQSHGLDFRAAVRTDGKSGKDNDDLFNAGLSYTWGNFYVAGAYLKSTAPLSTNSNEEGSESENISFAAYMNLDQLYIATAYQAITITPEVGDDSDVTTLDVSASYALANRYKLKAGVFMFDDDVTGATSAKHQGANITLERQLANNTRVHIEYLTRDFDERDTQSALTIGLRYDFSADL